VVTPGILPFIIEEMAYVAIWTEVITMNARKFQSLLVLGVLLISAAAVAYAEDDDHEGRGGTSPGAGSSDSGSSQPSSNGAPRVIRQLVTRTVYVPDPVAQQKLVDALQAEINESNRLKEELALQNATLQYTLDQLKAYEVANQMKDEKIAIMAADMRRMEYQLDANQVNSSLFDETFLTGYSTLLDDNASLAADPGADYAANGNPQSEGVSGASVEKAQPPLLYTLLSLFHLV